MNNSFRLRIPGFFLIIPLSIGSLLACQALQAQQETSDSLLTNASVDEVVRYALVHQPLVKQSAIDEAITGTSIRSKLADWYPQVNFNYNLQHNFQVQTSVIQGNPVKLGVDNNSALQFQLTQNIFNRDALLASRTATDVRKASQLNSVNTRVTVAALASKAFYEVLTTIEQIKVADEDILRLERSLQDARSRYEAGITDKIDYKRATIALNNARALRQSYQDLLKAKKENLKNIIGYPSGQPIDLVYDSLKMEKEAIMDTLQQVDFNSRPEYQLLQTQRKLYEANVKYNKWSYLPNLYAFGAYNMNFQNNAFSKLYNTNYPNSYAGLTLSLPILKGGKRKADIEQSEWELKRLDWDIVSLKNDINSEYASAMAAYKSNLVTYAAIKDNLDLAREVYDVIQLQYKAGVKTYLEVITAETDLRTARINYFNTLNLLLSSKIDVQKALGQINYQY